jgi:hypothetical protein
MRVEDFALLFYAPDPIRQGVRNEHSEFVRQLLGGRSRMAFSLDLAGIALFGRRTVRPSVLARLTENA